MKGVTDRISKYLIEDNKGIIFDELADKYLRSAGVYDILHGVPVPVAADMGEELSNVTIALGMARIIGADSHFPYRDKYLEYITKAFGGDFIRVIISEGAKRAGGGNYEVAAMMFRAALMLDPNSRDALYLYGRACKDAYEIEPEDEEYVGNFKAESLEAFEILTMLHPDFDMGYYFLGYGYINLGLYAKAELTWKEYMRLSEDAEGAEETRDEIAMRLRSLDEPVRIEQACNMVLTGDYQGGLEILREYTKTEYAKWWPLWYHIGTAESSLGNAGEAIEAYKRALALNPSNVALMGELAEVYEATGDEAGAAKYRRKIEIVLGNMEAEQQEL